MAPQPVSSLVPRCALRNRESRSVLKAEKPSIFIFWDEDTVGHAKQRSSNSPFFYRLSAQYHLLARSDAVRDSEYLMVVRLPGSWQMELGLGKST
jgi:hypothetical protein